MSHLLDPVTCTLVQLAWEDERGAARAVSELLAGGDALDWAPLFTRAGARGEVGVLRELVLIGTERIHVIERLVHRPDLALVVSAPREAGLGLALSAAHHKLAELDVE